MPAGKALAALALIGAPLEAASPAPAELESRVSSMLARMPPEEREAWVPEWEALKNALAAAGPGRKEAFDRGLVEFLQARERFVAAAQNPGADWRPTAAHMGVMRDRWHELELLRAFPAWRLRALFLPEAACPVRCGDWNLGAGGWNTFDRLPRSLRDDPYALQGAAAALYCTASDFGELRLAAAAANRAAALDRREETAPYCLWLTASVVANNHAAFERTAEKAAAMDPRNPYLGLLRRARDRRMLVALLGQEWAELDGAPLPFARRRLGFHNSWYVPAPLRGEPIDTQLPGWERRGSPRHVSVGDPSDPALYGEPERPRGPDNWEVSVTVAAPPPAAPSPPRRRGAPKPRPTASQEAYSQTSGMTPTDSKLLPALRSALARGDRNARLHAVADLGVMGKPALGTLVGALEDGDYQVRMNAVHWLGRMGPAGVPGLSQAMRTDPCRLVRLTAVHWLGSLGEDTLAELDETGEDPSPDMRAAGAYWRHRLTRPGTHQQGAADSALADSDRNICEQMDFPAYRADRFLPEAGASDGAAPQADAEPSAESSAPEPAPPGAAAPETLPDIPVVARVPDAPQVPEKPHLPLSRAEPEPALDATAPPGSPERMPGMEPIPAPGRPSPAPSPTVLLPERQPAPDAGLSKKLGAPEAPLQRPQAPVPREEPVSAYAALLDGVQAPWSVDKLPILLEILRKGDPRLRSRAADEIARIGPPAAPAVDALRERLRDPERRVRASAALALGNIGPAAEGAVGQLVRALRDPHPDVRYSAAMALGRLKTPRARRAFERYQREESRSAARR